MMQDTLQRGDLFAPATGSALPLKLEQRVAEGVERGAGVGGVFPCIVADPPWQLEMGEHASERKTVKRGKWGDPKQDNSRIAALQYPTMSVAKICALQVPAAKDAHCYIWTINRYVEDTYDVARAWGFEPSTLLYWLKQPMGLGLGGAFVPCVEPILFCRRGKLPVKSRCDRNWWGWPRGRHSSKPEEFQTIVESVSPGPYLEMFARRVRPGWSAWGNEVSVGPLGGGGRGVESGVATEPKAQNVRMSDRP